MARNSDEQPGSRKGDAGQTGAGPRWEPTAQVVLSTLTDDRILVDAGYAEGLEPPAALAPLEPGEEPMSADRLRAAYGVLVDWQQFYGSCARSASDRVEAERRALAAHQAALAEQLTAAEAARRESEQLLIAARSKQDDLAKREATVRAAEKQAEAGFRERADRAHEALTKELADRKDQATAELEQRLGELENRTLLVDREQAAIKARTINLDRREQSLTVEVEAHAAAQVAQLEVELRKAQTEAEANRTAVERLTAELASLQARWLAAGVRDPVAVLDELDAVKQENRELHDKLAARLDDDTLERLRRLEEQNRELHAEREQLTYEVEDLRGKVLFSKIHHLQLNQLAEAERQFDAITRGYEKRITELEGRWDQLHEEGPDLTKPLFPNCVSMDDTGWLQEVGELIDEPPDLAKLARDLQRAMYRYSDRKYRLGDVCSVLGGMAMSNLHLLQGMSGIGKTSLPIALAQALQTGYAVVEVQAGWRDRSDLFGSHNTFEGRFEESAFMLALYRAQTPRYRHRPYFIVLDEMNLSRPEQYFSVILSKLETGDEEPIRLVSTGQGQSPREMAPEGTSITVPRNVWFVGTANHDESTLEFADKTYNRAHVLELPTDRPWIPSGAGDVEPYSLKALGAAFSKACRDHGGELNRLRRFLTDIRSDLEAVGIAVGPRMEDQLTTYVPVVVATKPEADAPPPRKPEDHGEPGTEGSIGRITDAAAFAVDHFFAAKVLRQLSGKFEVTSGRIRGLRDKLLEHWVNHFEDEPTRCGSVLTIETQRRDA